jgi:hypothetical protein
MDYQLKDPYSHMLMLEWQRVASSHAIGAATLREAELHQFFDVVTDSLVHGLTTFVLTEQLPPKEVTKEVEVPETWWQHTKLVHFPTFSRWLRRPPRFRTITMHVEVEGMLTFPHSNLVYPKKLGKPVLIATTTVDGARWQ